MAFQLVLWSVGVLLACVSRMSAQLRAQLARDMTLSVASRDGVARSYVFRNRRVSSHAGLAQDADYILTFQTAKEGARIFLAPNAVQQICEGLASRQIEFTGEPANVLWFYEMVMAYVPGRSRRSQVMPDAYVAHNPSGKAADRITREPAVTALDPAWTGAVAQREKLILWQVGRSAPIEGKIKNFKFVVDVPASAMEEVHE